MFYTGHFCKFTNRSLFFFFLLHESSEKIHNDDLNDGYNIVTCNQDTKYFKVYNIFVRCESTVKY